MLKVINPHGTLLTNTLLQLAIFVVFALPGYAVAIWLLDRTGRRKIQVLGFAMMGLSFLLIGLVPGVTTMVAPFVILFGASYFFAEIRPTPPPSSFPPRSSRWTSGPPGTGYRRPPEMGAFAGAYLFPVMLASRLGLRGAEVISGVVCVLGLALAVALLPEPMGRSLEQLEADAFAPEVNLGELQEAA